MDRASLGNRYRATTDADAFNIGGSVELSRRRQLELPDPVEGQERRACPVAARPKIRHFTGTRSLVSRELRFLWLPREALFGLA